MLSEVEAAAQEFCKKILSVFQDNKPAGRTEHPQNQESSEQPQNQESSEQPQNQESNVIQECTPMTIIHPENQTSMLNEAVVAAQDYFKGRKHHTYLPLYLAANGGDWKSAKSFIERDPSASTARITGESLTTLMVATRARQWKFARKLLEDLPSKSLETVDIYGRTALHYATLGGSLKTVKALIRKNSMLTQIPDNHGHLTLYDAAINKQLLWYLILVTRDEHPSFAFTGPHSAIFIRTLIGFGYYDICLYLVRKYPELAFIKSGEYNLLAWLSFKYADFPSGSNRTFWERWIYKLIDIQVACEPPHSILVNMEDFLANAQDFEDKAASVQPMLMCLNRLLWKLIEKLAPPLKQVREEKWKHVYAVELVNHICSRVSASKTFEEAIEFFRGSPGGPPILAGAAALGIVEMIRTSLQYFPDLILVGAKRHSNFLQVAINNRQAKIFNLIKEKPSIALQLNIGMQKSETTLHLAAKLAPSSQLLSVSGSALQMQRELQWFKEVEKMTLPIRKPHIQNAEGLTAKELFTKEHKELAGMGEKWMKGTASSGMIVTTLIATVVLAAAFTVPGGNNNAGIPLFLRETSFLIFVVSDALALFSSITSLLMFLSIATARYEEEDFLNALPKRLILGLGSLFFAIASMMVVFGATLSIVLHEKWPWAFIPIIILASIPVAIFAKLQLPLFIQMIRSTYGSGIFQS